MFHLLKRGRTEKADLVTITATPLAKYQMDAQPEALSRGKRVIECFRLQPNRFFATWRKLRYPAKADTPKFIKPVHDDFTSPSYK